MANPPPPLLTGLLEQVSRSFYWSLRVLPGAVRPQLGLAYLLARATDTIADTEIVPLADRLRALEELRARLQGRRNEPVDFGSFAANQGHPAERQLLERIEEALALLGRFSPSDQALIRQALETITSGQRLDLERFARAGREVVALPDAAALDDYTYRVAGCVGEFWTRLCLEHVLPRGRVNAAYLLETGVQFGKGLQLVNILRDLPRDLQQGRCYLPATELAAAGLAPAALRDPANENRVRPVYDRHLATAQAYLRAGWDYTNALPVGHVRLRMACALPILIGIKTLAKLKNNPILPPDLRIKVTRAELRWILIRMVAWYPWPKQWQQLPSRQFFHTG